MTGPVAPDPAAHSAPPDLSPSGSAASGTAASGTAVDVPTAPVAVMDRQRLPATVDQAVRLLRRRGLVIGVDDCLALRQALAAGFGWESWGDLRELCVGLWAKSAPDAALVRAVFSRVELGSWSIGEAPPPSSAPLLPGPAEPVAAEPAAEPGSEIPPTPVAEVAASRRLGGLPVPWRTGRRDATLLLVPQFPVSEREIAQTCRRLRRPLRHGPRVELDVAATIDRRIRSGVATPPVLVPARRNTARLTLLIDRHGSMAPFHGFVDHVHRAIQHAGRLDAIHCGYFHDVPGQAEDRTVLEKLPDPFHPALDPILPLVAPMTTGRVYADAELTQPQDLVDFRATALTPGTGVIVISDGGAARGRLDSIRLLDTVALLKMLRAAGCATVWLNPLPRSRWRRSTAEQVARHVPSFPLVRDGLYRAVDALLLRPSMVDRPI